MLEARTTAKCLLGTRSATHLDSIMAQNHPAALGMAPKENRSCGSNEVPNSLCIQIVSNVVESDRSGVIGLWMRCQWTVIARWARGASNRNRNRHFRDLVLNRGWMLNSNLMMVRDRVLNKDLLVNSGLVLKVILML